MHLNDNIYLNLMANKMCVVPVTHFHVRCHIKVQREQKLFHNLNVWNAFSDMAASFGTCGNLKELSYSDWMSPD